MILIGKNKFLHIPFHQKKLLHHRYPSLLEGYMDMKKNYNIVTMTFIIIIMNSTIIPFHNDQIHVHRISIKYSSINLLVLFFVCSILKNNKYNTVIVRTKNMRVLAMLYSPVFWMIKCLFVFWIPGKRSYCCERMVT